MIMADVFKILFPVLGILISFVTFWLLFEAIFPGAVERSRREFERHSLRALLVGILFAGPILFIGAGLISNGNPAVKIAGFATIFALVCMGLLGSAGLTRHIGARLSSPLDAAQPWRRVLRGGIVLSLTYLFPFVGWFFILPVSLVSGAGAAVMAVWKRKASPSTPSPEADLGAAQA